jgi:hypothetical protein
MTIHGVLRRFQLDQGDQLVAASKQLVPGTGPRRKSFASCRAPPEGWYLQEASTTMARLFE